MGEGTASAQVAAGLATDLSRHGTLPALHAGDRTVSYDEPGRPGRRGPGRARPAPAGAPEARTDRGVRGVLAGRAHRRPRHAAHRRRRVSPPPARPVNRSLHPDLRLLLSTSGSTGSPKAGPALRGQPGVERRRHRVVPRADGGGRRAHHPAAGLLLRPLGAAQPPGGGRLGRARRSLGHRPRPVGGRPGPRGDLLRGRALHLRPARRRGLARPAEPAPGDPGRWPDGAGAGPHAGRAGRARGLGAWS
ncbi:hypothetical protein G5V59_13970 [Nocardioides sp. W3-2-3]|uniref:hypothetical protein n=1 Tax=Nocardioides convexus TaxID=2712224 RepID=UPI002418595A|nr:hypothetical protein [Nocardioides convexus]NHA00732.1 hypothetical protein [Nocardioides convexus]